MKFEEHVLRELTDTEYLAAYEELAPNLHIASQMVAIRTTMGLSQEQLAVMVGTAQASISRLENALSNPRLDFLKRVAKALGTRLSVRFERQTLAGTPEDIFDVPAWQVAWWTPTLRSEVQFCAPEAWAPERIPKDATVQLNFAMRSSDDREP